MIRAAVAEIKTYIQDRPADWLKDHPHELWRCDIYPAHNSHYHHGVGGTEAEALMNAALAYLKCTHRAQAAKSAAE